MRIPPVIAPTTLRVGTPTKLRAATLASERSPIPAAANPASTPISTSLGPIR